MRIRMRLLFGTLLGLALMLGLLPGMSLTAYADDTTSGNIGSLQGGVGGHWNGSTLLAARPQNPFRVPTATKYATDGSPYLMGLSASSAPAVLLFTVD